MGPFRAITPGDEYYYRGGEGGGAIWGQHRSGGELFHRFAGPSSTKHWYGHRRNRAAGGIQLIRQRPVRRNERGIRPIPPRLSLEKRDRNTAALERAEIRVRPYRARRPQRCPSTRTIGISEICTFTTTSRRERKVPDNVYQHLGAPRARASQRNEHILLTARRAGRPGLGAAIYARPSPPRRAPKNTTRSLARGLNSAVMSSTDDRDRRFPPGPELWPARSVRLPEPRRAGPYHLGSLEATRDYVHRRGSNAVNANLTGTKPRRR